MMFRDEPVTNEKTLVSTESLFDDLVFEKFFREHFLNLCAFCQFKYGFELDLAKDAVHNAFIRMWETREFISPDRSPKAYLYKVVSNISMDIIRHKKVKIKKEKLLLEKGRETAYNNGFEVADLKQLRADIDRAVSELPDQMRKVFELCRYEGLKYAEVAKQLEISIKTVENQMTRAHTRLRQKLSDYLLAVLFVYLLAGY